MRYILTLFILFIGLNSFALHNFYSVRTVGPVTIIESKVDGYETKQISLGGLFTQDDEDIDEDIDEYIEQRQREFIQRRDNWIRHQRRIRHQQELEFPIGLIIILLLSLVVCVLFELIYLIYKGAEKIYQRFQK